MRIMVSLEKEMVIYSSILAWGIPWTESEPGGLQSVGSQRVGHDLATEHTNTHGFPTFYFAPSRGRALSVAMKHVECLASHQGVSVQHVATESAQSRRT